MDNRPKLARMLVCLAVGLASICSLPGCGGGKKSTGPVGDENVIEPATTVDDAQNFKVNSACIGKAGATSDYVYGVVQIEYLGDTALSFVGVDATFKDKNGRTLFEDDSYINNPDLCRLSSTANSNSFFTPTSKLGYYCIIEDLSDHDIELAQIARVDLAISGSSYTFAAPGGHLAQEGSPYRSTPEAWHLNVRNDGTVAVRAGYSRFVFADDQDRVYQWAFATSYVGGNESSDYAVGAAGELVASDITPDYQDTPMDFVAALLEWDPIAPGKPAASTALASGAPRTPAEVALMAQQRDREERDRLPKP